MSTSTVNPVGWFRDPTGRHEYRYWDGATWTSTVSDSGVTATDAPQLPPPTVQAGEQPPAGPLVGQAVGLGGVEVASPVGYRASAVSTSRSAVVRIAVAAVQTALVSEVVASLILQWQINKSVFTAPSQATFRWWSWLYHYGPTGVVYGYPPVALWVALLLAGILLSALLIPPLQAVKKAGGKATFRWSAPAERSRLAARLQELGHAKTLLRGRGRTALVVISELAALGVVVMSAYALLARRGMALESGTYVGELSVGLGPIVCLVAGLIALFGGAAAGPWRGGRPVLVLPDGTVRVGDPTTDRTALPASGTGALPASAPTAAPESTGSLDTLVEAPAEQAAQRKRRPHWVIVVLAIAAALGVIAGLLVWAPWSTAPAPAGPVGIRAGTATTTSLTLQWSRPPTGAVPDHYVIVRDGSEVATVSGTVTAYKDTGLAPATAYVYTVSARWGDQQSEPSPALTMKTLTPSIASGRLEGTWNVDTTVVKAPGGNSTITVGKKGTESWHFTPKCTTGACAVTVAGMLGGHAFTATLTPSKGVYAGTMKAHITHCGILGSKVDVKNTLTVRITVKTAAVDNAEWTARSWVGSLVASSPYTRAGLYYCPAQSLTFALVASQ